MDKGTCPYCGERPLAKRKGAKTCGGVGCQQARNRETNRLAYAADKEDARARMRERRAARPGNVSLICPTCGSAFIGPKDRRFCSIGCSNKARSAEFKPTAGEDRQAIPCRWCGDAFISTGAFRGPTCSRRCERALANSTRVPITAAWRARDRDAFIAAIQDRIEVTAGGCWEFGTRNKAGYGTFAVDRHSIFAHRAMMELIVGRDLMGEPVHHKCANRACCNPEHLQLTTTRENVAEMHQRTYMQGRIAALEAELLRLDPANPLVRHLAA